MNVFSDDYENQSIIYIICQVKNKKIFWSLNICLIFQVSCHFKMDTFQFLTADQRKYDVWVQHLEVINKSFYGENNYWLQPWTFTLLIRSRAVWTVQHIVSKSTFFNKFKYQIHL